MKRTHTIAAALLAALSLGLAASAHAHPGAAGGTGSMGQGMMAQMGQGHQMGAGQHGAMGMGGGHHGRMAQGPRAGTGPQQRGAGAAAGGCPGFAQPGAQSGQTQ